MADFKDHPPPQRSDGGPVYEWYQMAGVGFEFIAAVLFCAGMGYLLDRWLGTQPWCLIGGVGFGFVVGLWGLIKRGMKSFKD
jgi:F0F1-type ATP synthase assembly protein I